MHVRLVGRLGWPAARVVDVGWGLLRMPVGRVCAAYAQTQGAFRLWPQALSGQTIGGSRLGSAVMP